MPTPVVSKLANQAGVSKNKAEEKWNSAKAYCSKHARDGDGIPEDDPAYYQCVTGMTKQYLGLNEQQNEASTMEDVREMLEEVASGKDPWQVVDESDGRRSIGMRLYEQADKKLDKALDLATELAELLSEVASDVEGDHEDLSLAVGAAEALVDNIRGAADAL